MNHIKTLKFSINNWQHLYSLQQAVLHNSQRTGRTLCIDARVVNCAFLNHKDSDISIKFIQLENAPDYPLKSTSPNTPGLPVLGSIVLSQQMLSTEIQVDRAVFEELRKNLMEYADIDGIHIIITLGLFFEATAQENDLWNEGQSLEIMQLDYAMKGDS
ncbi:hypothetical protein MNBD_GAMMA09-1376 [hydrothermal vent metagenome]|uniref:Uncharacterized protein n=1 Tax=hydrothermal vent metagenome TaxID=652676 RepID=A0A3B0XMB4_9ZZZZ